MLDDDGPARLASREVKPNDHVSTQALTLQNILAASSTTDGTPSDASLFMNEAVQLLGLGAADDLVARLQGRSNRTTVQVDLLASTETAIMSSLSLLLQSTLRNDAADSREVQRLVSTLQRIRGNSLVAGEAARRVATAEISTLTAIDRLFDDDTNRSISLDGEVLLSPAALASIDGPSGGDFLLASAEYSSSLSVFSDASVVSSCVGRIPAKSVSRPGDEGVSVDRG
eukprot:scaffold1596_cov302-Pinguiococcus_pyrenoidosus.AAC.29